jgi:hypothetical protein
MLNNFYHKRKLYNIFVNIINNLFIIQTSYLVKDQYIIVLYINQ